MLDTLLKDLALVQEKADHNNEFKQARENSFFKQKKSNETVAVGTGVTSCPPHRSGRALLTHPAPTLGAWRRSVAPDKGGLSLALESSGLQAFQIETSSFGGVDSCV